MAVCRMLGLALLGSWLILGAGSGWAQQDSNPPADANPAPKLEAPPRYDTPSSQDEDQPGSGSIHAPAQPGKAPSTAQRSEDSSSRSTIVDLSPPAGDAQGHPHSDISAGNPTGVNEMSLWDPHRAEKNVEVGDYYFREKNYRAAESRYREALMYKPDDAVATYRLAQALEKNGNLRFALQNYEHYLKILPHGSFAPDARKAAARVQAELDK